MSIFSGVNNPGLDFVQLTQAEVDLLAGLAGQSYSEGDLLYYHTGSLKRLPIGSTNNVLTVISGDPSWQPAGTTANLTVGTSTVSSGTNTRVLFDNSGVLGEYAISGTGSVAMTTSPVFTTPTLGAASGTSLNLSGLTVSSAVATDASKNLVSVINTGTGNNVLATSPSVTGATLTTTTVNGVTLTTGGGTTTFLNANGAYSAPAGSGTVNSGTNAQFAYYASTGTAVSGNSSVTFANSGGTPRIVIGSGTEVGGLIINGGTSITSTILPGTVSANITLPSATSTLYGTASASITSSQLATSLSDETGTGVVMFGTSPTVTTSILAAASTANIGNTTTGWAHLYMTSGGILDFGNGNVTITHATGVLTVGTSMDLRMTTAGTNATSVVTLGGTQTLSNKRTVKLTSTVAGPGATPSINTDTSVYVDYTAVAANITGITVTGTPNRGDTLWISFTDNGTARTIVFGTSFEASTVPLPTTTVISTRLDVGFVWDVVTSKWRCVAVA